MSRNIVSLSLLALFLGASPAWAVQQADGGDELTPEERVDTLFADFDRTDGPGAAVAVVLDGEVVHKRGYGMADLEQGVPITPRTRFQVASISKQFATFAIHLREADGALSVDDDIREYLPEMHDFGPTITIRHMLNHTSGLRELGTLRRLAGWRSGDLTTHEDLLDASFRLTELNFEPGSEYVYNNTGYTLLAEIVERASGQSFREFSQERIFGPLGMTDSHVSDDAREVIPDRAPSYAPSSDGYQRRPLNFSGLGSTGLFTTLEDMIRWDRNFETAEVGGPEVLAAMHERGRLNDGEAIDYGSGLMLDDYRGADVVRHTGSHAGYRAAFFRIPEHGFTVIILANFTGMDRTGMPRQVADIYLDDVLDPVEEVVEEEAPEPDEPEEEEPREPTREELEAYAGEYYSEEAGAFVRVGLEDDELVLRTRKESSRLNHREDDTFSGFGSTIRFVRDGDGAVEGFLVSNARLRDLRFVPAELRVAEPR